ncbi:hypothetical protein QF038_003686 [Pseudarthrobacter sp. W1I19]|nr:hypothetical protein [Pseudarthrobacter sp. W1I19]
MVQQGAGKAPQRDDNRDNSRDNAAANVTPAGPPTLQMIRAPKPPHPRSNPAFEAARRLKGHRTTHE